MPTWWSAARRTGARAPRCAQGVLAAHGRTVAFTDADLSYAPDQILRLLDGVEDGWDVVVGSRQHTDTRTVVRAGRLREVGGRVINLLTGVVLLGRYRDTQCGLKAFRSDVARLVFAHTHVDGFAFDVEVFHLVERYRLTLRRGARARWRTPSRSTVQRGARRRPAGARPVPRPAVAAAAGVYDVDASERRCAPAVGAASGAARRRRGRRLGVGAAMAPR